MGGMTQGHGQGPTRPWAGRLARAGWRGAARGGLALGVILGAALGMDRAHAAPLSALPQRNLLVEWRTSAASESQGQGAGLRRGELTVDSQGGVQGQGSVGVTATSRSRMESGLQQVRVLNGGKARIYLGSSRPVTQWQFGVSGTDEAALRSLSGGGASATGGVAAAQASAASGSPRLQAWSSTTLVDTGRGLTVRPRWQGGRTVTVELDAKVAQQAPYAPDGQVDATEVMTTVQLPLGAWTEIARRGGQVQQHRRGVLSTEDIDQGDNDVLEMRISLP